MDRGIVELVSEAIEAKRFGAIVNRRDLDQEYHTPYTPEQNGMIERFFWSLKAERAWLHRFRDRDHAFGFIAAWLVHYRGERPQEAREYLTPDEYRKRSAA